ncbi:MAG: YlmC/YmxH family sporulation protein [Lachnospiraceae bacterium]|nr:YlmC/YmxH family sporulation protein [Lachnospiraceae bacterium]
MVRLSELRFKEVINECTCKRLGCIEDLEFDPCTGQICAVIIPGQTKCFGLFGKEEEFVIPFKCICQIGPDIVLVKVDEKAVLKG